MIAVATAEVHTIPWGIGGKKVYQVRVEAKTSRLLDFIWKMRDSISSTFAAKALSPSHFTFSQRENSRSIANEPRLDQTIKKWAVNRQQVVKKPIIYQFDAQNTLDPI